MRAVASLVCAASAGCAASPAISAAQRGDRDALRAAVDRRERAGNLSTGEAACLAKTVADRDLRAPSLEEALARVRNLGVCAHELDASLEARMRTHDAAGAAAALARIEAHGWGLDDARAFLGNPDPAWRAVGARGLVRAEDRAARTRAFLDADPAIRRQAVRAAADATDVDNLRALLDVARVDPAPLVRTEAVRAIAALPPAPGDTVALALRDLWTAGDAPLRADVAVAWAAPTIWDAGGRDALREVVASYGGAPAIEAAAAVLRRRGADPEMTQLALGHLARAVTTGSRAERLQAIAEAPFDRPALEGVLADAAHDDDLEVRASALARLAQRGDASARRDLEALAQPASPVAERAQMALAQAGDRRVQSWLEEGLSAREPANRVEAAIALAALGVPARAAPLLADPDGAVRARVACTLIEADRSRR